MRKAKIDTNDINKDSPPSYKARSIEARENQMIALSYDLVEKRLRAGTATSQETTHFLRLGSTKEKYEKDMLKKQIELLEAKIESLQSARRIEELYSTAIKAVQSYSSPSISSIQVDDHG